MKDFLGNEMHVGDDVVIMVPKYKKLQRSKVLKITQKGIKATYKNTYYNSVEEAFFPATSVIKVIKE